MKCVKYMKICFNMTEILDINVPLNFWLVLTCLGNIFGNISILVFTNIILVPLWNLKK